MKGAHFVAQRENALAKFVAASASDALKRRRPDRFAIEINHLNCRIRRAWGAQWGAGATQQGEEREKIGKSPSQHDQVYNELARIAPIRNGSLATI